MASYFSLASYFIPQHRLVKGFFLFLLTTTLNQALAQEASHEAVVDDLNQKAWDMVESNPDRANELVLQAFKLSEEINYQEGKAFSRNTSGVLAQDNGVYEDALSHFEASLAIRLKLGDSTLIASVYHNLASLKEMMGDCGKAFEDASIAIQIWERLAEEVQLGKAYNTIAGIHECNGNFEDAINYTRKSLGRLRPFEDWNAIGDAEYNLGRRFYMSADDYENVAYLDSAVVHYEQALDIFENKIDDQAGHAYVLNGLGMVQVENNQPEIAERLFYQAIEKATAVGDSLTLSDVNYNLSLLYESKKDFTNALSFLEAADQILGDKGSELDQQYLSEQYARIYKGLGEFEKAYGHLEYSDSLKTIRFEEEREAELAQQEAAFKNDLLAKDNIAQKIKTQKNRQFKNIFGVIALLLLIILCLGIYVFRQRRQSANIRHQQAIDELMEKQERKFIDAYFEGQEEEKKKYSDQLHTHLGGLLVAAKWDYDGLLEAMEKEDSNWAGKLRLANTKLQNVYQEVRRKSHEFGTSRLEKIGLIAALQDLCKTVSESGRIKATFNAFGLKERLDPKTELVVYRIVQELVTNVLKHAKAKHLAVQINPIDSVLSIMVEDDGEGFDYNKAVATGLGLSDVSARAESLKGSVNFDTNKGAGTTVIIDIPLPT